MNKSSLGGEIKVKTGYLVQAIIYVPLIIGGVPFGVLCAAHHHPQDLFSQEQEQLMVAVADFTAIAIHNARRFDALNSQLTHRVKLITAVNYALSDQLRSEVNAITGYAGLISSDDAFAPDAIALADSIIEDSSRALHLIDRLAEATMLSDHDEFHYAPCNLHEVITAALNDLHRYAAQKSIELRFSTLGEAYWINGDFHQLQRSVYNLVHNAIKFSEPHTDVEVALLYWQTHILISVRDNGPGIPTQNLPDLFDRYVRGPQPSGDYPGLGLGLEQVRATAEAHRGKVVAHNNENGGAEFVFNLPGTLRILPDSADYYEHS